MMEDLNDRFDDVMESRDSKDLLALDIKKSEIRQIQEKLKDIETLTNWEKVINDVCLNFANHKIKNNYIERPECILTEMANSLNRFLNCTGLTRSQFRFALEVFSNGIEWLFDKV